MQEIASRQISHLLIDWSRGDELALEQLMPLVYEELRQMARGYMRGQSPGHTLQTTELIHEAFLKISKGGGRNWENRAHFFGVAARAMRQILVDYARSKSRQKRGGWQERVTMAEGVVTTSNHSKELLALDDALQKLEQIDARRSRVVELKFFGGLTVEEVAEVLKISPETANRDWQFARTWLLRELASAV